MWAALRFAVLCVGLAWAIPVFAMGLQWVCVGVPFFALLSCGVPLGFPWVCGWVCSGRGLLWRITCNGFAMGLAWGWAVLLMFSDGFVLGLLWFDALLYINLNGLLELMCFAMKALPVHGNIGWLRQWWLGHFRVVIGRTGLQLEVAQPTHMMLRSQSSFLDRFLTQICGYDVRRPPVKARGCLFC